MSLSFLNQKAIRSAAANSESPLSRCRSLILLVSKVHRSEFIFTVGMMWPKFPGTPSHFIKTVSILRVCHTPTALSLSSYVHGREPMLKSTCGTTNPYAGHVASQCKSWACWTCHGQTPMWNIMACHQHVGHVMVKFLLKHEKIHEHIEHVIGKFPCDTLARHELAKLLVNLTSDMLWDMLGFFIFKLTSSMLTE